MIKIKADSKRKNVQVYFPLWLCTQMGAGGNYIQDLTFMLFLILHGLQSHCFFFKVILINTSPEVKVR